MNLKTLGPIIATRTFELAMADGGIGEVLIKIGKPKKHQNNSSYCPYQIIGIGDERIRYAMGSDGVQSLILAMTKIGADIYTSPEAKDRRLTWMEDDSNNLGIPVMAEVFEDKVPSPSIRLIC